MDSRNDAQAIIDVSKASMLSETLELTGPDGKKVQVVAVPSGSGRALQSIKKYFDEYRTKPEFRTGTATLATLDSLVDHANRFKDEHSVLFADPNPAAPVLLCVLDYHERTAAGSPRFGKHIGRYAFPVSEQWSTWTDSEKNDQWQPMQEFAEFIDANIVDIADPSGAFETTKDLAAQLGIQYSTPSAVLSAARGLQVKVEQNVKHVQNAQSGECEVLFEEKHAGDGSGGKVKVPNAFLLSIPVFKSGTFFQIVVRLRYRVQNGRISFAYALHRADRAFEHAFNVACKKASEATGLPLFYGSPER